MSTRRDKKTTTSKKTVTRSKPPSKKPAKKMVAKKNGGRRTISMTTYRKLRASYIEHQCIETAARAAGVKSSTARKYIVDGVPEKNMPAIRDIAKRQAVIEQGELELSLRAFRRQYQKELLEALSGSLIEIRLHNAKTRKLAEKAAAEQALGKDGEIVEPSSKFVEQVKSHDLLIRLMERSFGEADETVSVEPTDYVKRMTPEELVIYIKTGEIPEHLR